MTLPADIPKTPLISPLMLIHAAAVFVYPHFASPLMLMAVDMLSPPMLLVDIDCILLSVITLSVEFTPILLIYNISPALMELIPDDFTTVVPSVIGPVVIPLISISPATMDYIPDESTLLILILSPMLIVVDT